MIMIVFLVLSFFSLISSQQTGVTCSSVVPISVPKDPSLYWGTWYTIAPCTNCTNPSNVCTQVIFEPYDSTEKDTNVTYIGSYQLNTPKGKNNQAFGTLSPVNIDTFNPLYQLQLDVGIIVKSNFWILTTAGGNDDEITAIVTMSCELSGTNQQLFILSRKPYLIPPVTFDSLISQVQRAITNYDQFEMLAVLQPQGWCEYQYPETEIFSDSTSSDNDDNIDQKWQHLVIALIIISTFFSFSSLVVLLWLRFSKYETEKKQLLVNI